MTRAARILLVDDEQSIQKGLRPLLASRGYQVESATTGQGALEASGDPDLLRVHRDAAADTEIGADRLPQGTVTRGIRIGQFVRPGSADFPCRQSRP